MIKINGKAKCITWVTTISIILSGIVGIVTSISMLKSQLSKVVTSMEASEMGPSLEEVRLMEIEASIDSLEAYHKDNNG